MQRNTSQRRAIQHAFEHTPRPLSPAEVLESARASAPSIGIATVYRALRQLVDEHWLVQVDLPGKPPLYERAGKHHHHHFHCHACGQVFEAEGCPATLGKLVPPGFELEAHDVVLYGRCASCVASAAVG